MSRNIRRDFDLEDEPFYMAIPKLLLVFGILFGMGACMHKIFNPQGYNKQPVHTIEVYNLDGKNNKGTITKSRNEDIYQITPSSNYLPPQMTPSDSNGDMLRQSAKESDLVKKAE